MKSFSKLNFRNGIDGSKYIILLPLIAIAHLIINHKANRSEPLTIHLMNWLLINNALVLLAFRFNINLLLFMFSNLCLFVSIHSLSVFSCLNPIIFLLLLIFNTIILKILRTISDDYICCFTFGEFAIVAQCLIYYLFRILLFNLENLNLIRFYFHHDSPHITEVFCLTCYSTFLLCLILSILIKAQAFRHFCLVILFPITLYFNLKNILKLDPFVWIVQYFFINNIRIRLLFVWSIILGLTCTFVVVHAYYSKKSTTTTTRKIFHLAITIVYLVGIQYDLEFLNFASKLILFIFIYVEIIRLIELPMVGSTLNHIFDRFRDEKDEGKLTLTHIYLLVGCSSPIWLHYNWQPKPIKVLLSSGIIAVGIGDTVASYIGYNYGKHPLPNSKKTWEGTLSFFISQILTMFLMEYYFNDDGESFPLNVLINHSICLVNLLKIILISSVGAILEASTKHVDNLILPLVQYFMMMMLVFL